jgi:hypothetical protein
MEIVTGAIMRMALSPPVTAGKYNNIDPACGSDKGEQ